MPSEEAMDRAWGADFLVPVRSGKPNIAALVLKAGIRAQIAVLEECRNSAVDPEDLTERMDRKLDELGKELA